MGAREHGLPVHRDRQPARARVPIDGYALPERCVLLFGQEGPGLSEEARALAMRVLAIRQFGSTRSINAARGRRRRDARVDPPSRRIRLTSRCQRVGSKRVPQTGQCASRVADGISQRGHRRVGASKRGGFFGGKSRRPVVGSIRRPYGHPRRPATVATDPPVRWACARG